MVKLAFYKGKGTWADKLIRLWTLSKYSHVEIVVGKYWYTSSQPEGGVVKRTHLYNENSWDFVDITNIVDENTPLDIEIFYKETQDCGYDWKGIILSQISDFGIHSTNKWFCSEWVTEALKRSGMLIDKKSNKVSPGKLYRMITNESRN